jgi:hypothetical protein
LGGGDVAAQRQAVVALLAETRPGSTAQLRSTTSFLGFVETNLTREITAPRVHH